MEEIEEIKKERRVWRECILCEEEYSEDIRMNEECLHSYCFPCIQQTSSTSHLCPICHLPLPSPLSSLPLNHSLLFWTSLFPSPPLSSSTSLSSKMNILKMMKNKSVMNVKRNMAKYIVENVLNTNVQLVHNLFILSTHENIINSSLNITTQLFLNLSLLHPLFYNSINANYTTMKK